MVHLGKRFNTHGVHLLESESLQIFFTTFVIRGNVIVTADVEVEALQSKNQPQCVCVCVCAAARPVVHRDKTYQHCADSRADCEIGDSQVIASREFFTFEKSIEHLE